uniref:Rab3-GAP regulatory subunit N-terminal domain-containing protein n=3 Tax=Clastoptera arizonana TaxID=38151 RepID=A0A1B6DPT0_9HEMI
MSCQINLIASIVDIESLQKCLFYNSILGPRDDHHNLNSQSVCRPTWLDECCVSLSPTGELLVITHKTNLVILTSKWDSQEESNAKTKYHITWTGDPCQEPNEVITSVLCLPLAATQSSRTALCAPDWTCISLGFSSGALRFYTETGSVLLSEIFHEGPVTGLKCQTFTTSKHTFAPELSDELHVVYKNVMCSIFGFVLSNTLRTCRNQLARVQANIEETYTPPPLSVLKWNLVEQDNMVDCVIGLPQCPTSYSHLVTASMCGGFNAWYRPTPPQSSLVIAVGNKPFIGFHYAIEGRNTPILSDVAKAMATKLKSTITQAVPGWLLGSKPTTPKLDKPLFEPAEPMVCRFGLCDVWRQGTSISISPQRNLSAVPDSLGRVTLVDNSSGLALRMWKGYRDAQCGWITAEEEHQNNTERKRNTLFLVIYAPKKAIIEVWALQQGPRVATFMATKHGKLLSSGYSLLGMNSLNKKKTNKSSFQCAYLDEEGNLKEITVPFHLALSDKNSKRARDIHLLKKMKVLLKEEAGDTESSGVVKQCQELKTNEMRIQALDILCASNRVSASILLDVVESFIHVLDVSEDDQADSMSKLLLHRCRTLQKLLIFYQFTLSNQQKPPDYETVISDDSNNDLSKLSDFLHTTEEELQRLLLLVTTIGSQTKTMRIKFKKAPEGLVGYLAAFSTNTLGNTILLNESNANDNLVYLSETIFQGSLDNIPVWEEAVNESCINAVVLMQLALVYWLNKPTMPTISEIYSFSQLIQVICKIAGNQIENKTWWDNIRAQLQDSNFPIAAITATLVCRSVALSFEDSAVKTENSKSENESEEEKNNDWEKISEDFCTWTQLLSDLEDIAVVYSILRRKSVSTNNSTLQCLEYEIPEFSLSSMLSKGKGCISELVSKWLTSFGFNPSLLLDSENNLKSPEPVKSSRMSVGVQEGMALEIDDGTEAQALSSHECTTLSLLKDLRQHFPYSLNGNILVVNMCWEYVLTWSREVDLLKYLESALHCLKITTNHHLKQGICSMLWAMHLKMRFETSVRLINKVGKVPKERLCRQDIGLSDVQVTDFFKICSDFLDIFMESNVLSEVSPQEGVHSEILWSHSSVPSLQQLALDQPSANYDILNLLSQCCRAFYFLTTFNLKTTKPLNAFFDSIGQSALISNVNSQHVQLPGHFVDDKLTQSRTHFLLRAVTGAMSTVIQHNGEYNTKQAVNWMSQCLTLAADWMIPADPLRRQQVCELYARGFDRIAEEIIPAVNELSLLGSQLLVIAARRLKKLLRSSSNGITHLSPSLTTWIDSLDEGTEEETHLAETSQLAVTAFSLLAEDHKEYRNARLLVEALQPFLTSKDK